MLFFLGCLAFAFIVIAAIAFVIIGIGLIIISNNQIKQNEQKGEKKYE